MKFLRNKMMSRTMAIFMLVVFVQSLILPNYAFALTTGPHQPEYTAYEEPGATDMVNLATGDFTFNLPILEVPGPEGSFTVPLTYHAGIGLDQEASWVGLGWTLNAGAITRAINEYPDDAAGEAQSITVQDLTGVRGWTSSLLGLGQIGWNTMSGHYGTISLLSIVNYSYDEKGTSSVGLIGINVSRSGSVSFDPVQFCMAVITIVTYGAAAAANTGVSAAVTIAKQAAMDIAVGAAMSAFTPTSAGIPSSPTAGYWKYSKRVDKRFLHKNYWIWLDKTRKENMYGILHLGKVNTETFVDSEHPVKVDGVTETLHRFLRTTGSINQGAASDINYYMDENLQYFQTNNPSTLALDSYSVKAPGISGAIAPYRLDIGSVAVPREMTQYHGRLAPIRYADYKPPFIYEGAISNSYYHHSGGATAVTSPGNYTGITVTVANSNPSDNIATTQHYNDVIFKNQRVRSDVSDFLLPATKLNKFPQGNHVEWLTNGEIKATATYASKFIDFLSAESPTGITGSDRYSFRSNFTLGSSALTSSFYTSSTNFSATIQLNSSVIGDFQNGSPVTLNADIYNDAPGHNSGSGAVYKTFTTTVSSVNTSNNTIVVNTVSDMFPYFGKFADIEVRYNKTPQIQNAIGGYSITAQDGTNYHFALPIYDYDQKTEIKNVSDPNNKKSIITRPAPFANTWLLTSITGADFIDRNSNGLADDGDWGYYVKFNYGKHVDDYQWRIPFEGDTRSVDNLSDSYTHGFKQLYYLNSIETRSHVALFLKSARNDSRSFNTRNSLKLDEIALISKEHYKKLIKPIAQGGFGMIDFSNKISNICWSTSFNGGARDLINFNCLKRIVFTHTYDLCTGTLNSVSGGKLTLTRVAILGRNGLKIVPDYKFEYGPDPNYQKDKWDGWGFYNPSATSTPGSHKASLSDMDGAAWSLTKVTTPVGSEISVNYERDTYSKVSSTSIYGTPISFSNPNTSHYYPIDVPIQKLYVNHNYSISVGDRVLISGDVNYKCPANSFYTYKTYSGEFTVTEINSNYIKVGTDYMGIGSCGSMSSGQFIHFEFQNGTVTKVLNSKVGGNLRVGSIVTKNEFGTENKIRYLYTNENGSSSGVVSKEPEYIKTGGEPAFYKTPAYPFTPVIYGRVTLLTGKLTTDADFHTRQVFEFETPHESMVSVDKVTVYPQTYTMDYLGAMPQYTSVYQHNITNRTSKIGTLNRIRLYDGLGNLVNQTDMTYTDQVLNNGANNYQGIYTEGVISSEAVVNPTGLNETYYRVNRTTSTNYPYTLKKVVTSKDGFTSESENISWDPLTGAVLEKIDKSPLGIRVKTILKPAYIAYPGSSLGPKALNASNKNMLGQIAAENIYKTDALGNIVGLIGASAQTWRNDWSNYRYYNGTIFTESPVEPVSQANPVWRKGPAFVWKGSYSRLQSDGTHQFGSGDAFNFSSGASNPLWQYSGEILRYDHFSMPLESKDHRNIYSSIIMGYDDRSVVAEADNAQLREIAFSSAEDLNTDKPFFGGEVALGSGSVKYLSQGQTSTTHTGDAVVALSSGYSFVFKTSGLEANKLYRASVWTNSTNGRIYYKINGGAENLSPAPPAANVVNGWYRIDLVLPAQGTSYSLEIGVKSNGGEVLFDDFRFQPRNASMICKVAAPGSFEFTSTSPTYSSFSWILDDDNFFTRYEYNERGLLIKTYQESFKHGVKLVSESKDNYRRFHINQ